MCTTFTCKRIVQQIYPRVILPLSQDAQICLSAKISHSNAANIIKTDGLYTLIAFYQCFIFFDHLTALIK